jgi:hypothetical protein
MLKRWLPILIIVFLAACAPAQDQLVFPEKVKVPYGEVNTAISLVDLPIMENSHLNNESLELNLKNLSDMHIYFPTGYGIQIFSYKEKIWESVQNNTYYPEEDFYLPTAEEFQRGMLVGVMPTIIPMDEPIEIYVFLYGNSESPDGELVGAYYTYTLLPNEELK